MQISFPLSAVPLKGLKMKEIWVRFLTAAILLFWDFPVHWSTPHPPLHDSIATPFQLKSNIPLSKQAKSSWHE